MPDRLAGKAALVTGAASGLGKATAQLLAAEGARVAVADVNADGARDVAAAIGPAAIALDLDVTAAAAWQAAIDATVRAFGGLAVLVNNAGIAPTGTIETTTLEDWRRIHAIDLDGAFLGCKLALPAMAETVRAGSQGGGSIVNISSLAGTVGVAHYAAYGAAKAGVRLLTKSVALHCARQGYGIRCNSVHPGSIDTPILDPDRAKYGEKAITARARAIPMGRIGRPIEVAYAVCYLASDESSFTTGSEIYVDGGYSAR